jgi:hypothetical protein
VKDQLPIKELKAHIEKQANHNEALQGLVNVSKALSGSIEKWGDRWEERREEHQLNELIPQVPDYLSKIPDEEIYFSRFTFEELVVKQQKLMTELNLLFGAVAVVGAFFTAGGSLYLLAIANGVWGVAQIGVSTMKLRDLNDGEVSDTSFFGINQEMLDVTGLMLGAVDLKILASSLLKGAKRAYNAKNMNAVQEFVQQKPAGGKVFNNEMHQRVLDNIAKSRLAREASNYNVYLKNEKILLKAINEHKLNMGKVIDEQGNFNLASGVLNGGRINESQLKAWVPPLSTNRFKPDPGIIDNGFKHNFIYNGTKVEIKWHSPQLDLDSTLTPAELAMSNSYNGWTAQIKIGRKYLGSDGNLYRNNRQNITHIPVNLGG